MAVIDADAHVVETERTWEYMEEAERPFKPQVVVPKAGGDREYWLIEGRAFAKNTNIGKDAPDEAQEVSDIATRLALMDALGVDVHILYPSIFLKPLTRRPDAEVTLSGATTVGWQRPGTRVAVACAGQWSRQC